MNALLDGLYLALVSIDMTYQDFVPFNVNALLDGLYLALVSIDMTYQDLVPFNVNVLLDGLYLALVSIEEGSLPCTADNTKKKMRWAINVFRKWQLERNELAKRDENISCIAPDIEEMTKDELCYSLSRFVCEVIKENGEDYPGQTLYEILINIQMHFEQKGKCYKF
ncbi:unnamed protein product [Mytilus edulis]|uniref:QRICH1-like domain-containing protein n=1 Tax=Mytilus edulis TaxID=6550 RepID=A0A8S3V538_MYTED|nr:unnamed protein product [Mytilus edulis]